MSSNDSYNNVPSEIWHKIIKQLSQKDLVECQKVCKSWYLSTRQYCYWDNIELKTAKNVVSFLNGFPNDAKNYVKSIVIGDQHTHCDPPVEYTLSKEQSKELLLNLPNLEKIDMTSSFAKTIIHGINNEEFLIEFRKNRCNFSSINVFETPNICPRKHGYAPRYIRSSTVILIDDIKYRFYCRGSAYLQLEHHNIVWDFRCFIELLHKIKMLPRMKYLNFQFTLHNQFDTCRTDIPRIIDEDQELKERLASIEKINWIANDKYILSIIAQYFIGLKEIDTLIDLDDLTSEFENFVFSHDKYKLDILAIKIARSDKAIKCLKNHIMQNSMDNKKITKHIWFELDCFAYNKLHREDYNFIFEYSYDGSLLLESKKIDDQLLKFMKIFLMDSENTLSKLFYRKLDPEKCIIKNIDILTFEFINEAKDFLRHTYINEKYLINYNTLQLIDQILSLATDVLQKVIIKTDTYCKWSKNFVKYEKVNTYRQVTQLEVYVRANNGELLYDLTLSQLTVVFPCVKYLTLGYFHDTEQYHIPNGNELFINLPHLNLKKLTLDATILKLMAQEVSKTQNNFTDTYFMLKVEANQKLYRYQISLDSLNVNELVENDKEPDIRKSVQVYIILKNIECLEFNIYIVDNECKEQYNYDWYYEQKNIKEKICDCRIYFE